MSNHAILVTGTAGFIGFHAGRELMAAGRDVVGLDSINDYYDPELKRARLALLGDNPRFNFIKADLADRSAIAALFAEQRFAAVIHLAAQAGVRYSISNPHAYAGAKLEGFVNVLEGCRHQQCPHLIYASSSSVYGAKQNCRARWVR
jgi:UDP-glucuronate 4-epimerase